MTHRTDDMIMTEVDGNIGIVIIVEILWSNCHDFKTFDVVWTEDAEPSPTIVTGQMKLSQGLQLVSGGLLAWDENETIAMTVRLKGHEQEKTKNDSGATT